MKEKNYKKSIISDSITGNDYELFKDRGTKQS